MKREILLLVAIFVVLSLVFHYEQFLSFPITHIQNLQNSGAYGFGVLHPLVFTLFAYLLLAIPRAIIKLIKKISK